MKLGARFLHFWFGSYRDVLRLLLAYLQAYGGLTQVIRSPYAHLSLLITVLTHGYWICPGWWELPLSVLPNLVGFTLSGYAVVMTLGDSKLRMVMMERPPGKPSAFMSINATFLHFLILQIISIVLAVLAKARPINSWIGPTDLQLPFGISARMVAGLTFYAVSYTFFVYALVSTLAAASAIFRIGTWMDKAARPQQDER